MERMEMVEKIRERANITVEEARDVLERNNWDMLDAMVELERAGKIHEGAETTTKTVEPEYEEVKATFSGKEEERMRRAQSTRNFKEGLKKCFRAVLDNKFVVNKKEEEIIRVPILVPIICLLSFFWPSVIVLVGGMVFGLRYSFEGKEFGKASINEKMAKAGEYTQNIVNDFAGKKGNAADNAGNNVSNNEAEVSVENEQEIM